MKIAVVGAGVFGAAAALELAKKHSVTLIDRNARPLDGATTHNHLRHHEGFHYPRSPETVEQIRSGLQSFKRSFGESIFDKFPAYYAVARESTKTTPDRFLEFCREQRLSFEECAPPAAWLSESKIAICIRTHEPVFDPDILRNIIMKRLASNSNIQFRPEVNVSGIFRRSPGVKIEMSEPGRSSKAEDFDVVVNATYSEFGQFHEQLGLEKPIAQFELVELLDIQLPARDPAAVTIVDGEFPSLLPRGATGRFTLGHVRSSIHRVTTGAGEGETLLNAQDLPRSAAKEIIADSSEFIPLLKDVLSVRPFFVKRVVPPFREADDRRLTEIIDHGNGVFTIFGGKVLTAVSTAEALARQIG